MGNLLLRKLNYIFIFKKNLNKDTKLKNIHQQFRQLIEFSRLQF